MRSSTAGGSIRRGRGAEKTRCRVSDEPLWPEWNFAHWLTGLIYRSGRSGENSRHRATTPERRRRIWRASIAPSVCACLRLGSARRSISFRDVQTRIVKALPAGSTLMRRIRNSIVPLRVESESCFPWKVLGTSVTVFFLHYSARPS